MIALQLEDKATSNYDWRALSYDRLYSSTSIMSLQDLDSLINLLKSDPALRQRLIGCSTVTEASELLHEAGYSLSEQELLSLRSSSQVEGLNDTDLEAVAGGAGDKNSNAETCRNQGCEGR